MLSPLSIYGVWAGKVVEPSGNILNNLVSFLDLFQKELQIQQAGIVKFIVYQSTKD